MKITLGSVANFLKSAKKTLLMVIIVSLLTITISAAISIWLSRYHNMSFPSIGTIQVIGVGVYGGDINTTQDGIPYIDWGTVYPGTVTNRSFYVESQSNVPITLSLRVSNLTFQNSKDQNVTANLPIENPLNLTWNYNNTILNPGEKIYVTLTLEVSFDLSFLQYLVKYDVRKFSFDVAIRPL